MTKSNSKEQKAKPGTFKPPFLGFKKTPAPKFYTPKTFRITQHKGG